MAKFVIAGSANCPYFARAELLADNLQIKLPDFEVHKIVKEQDEWAGWLSQTCRENSWTHSSSPLIWRELLNRGGRGVLIGGSNEFQEYAAGYYDITSSMLSSDMTTVASENMATHQSVLEEAEYVKSLSKPLRVCFTDSSNPVVYHMLQELASGGVVGEDVELSYHLLVKEEELDKTRGICLEVVDMAHPLLRDIQVTTETVKAMEGVDLVIVSDDLSQSENESWETWIKRCALVYSNYGSVIKQFASPDCKVVVSGRGALNLGAYLIEREADNLGKRNVVISSRLPENRAKSTIARRIHVNSSGVVNVIVWGNRGGKTHVDLRNSSVHGCEGAIWGPPSYSRPVKDMVHDDKWLQIEYLQSLATYGEYIEGTLGHASSVSEAHSVVSTIKDWWNGTSGDGIYSLGVSSSGYYGVPEGLFFSFPVSFSGGGWTVNEGIDISEELQEQLSEIVQELQREVEVASSSIQPVPAAGSDTGGDMVFGGEQD